MTFPHLSAGCKVIVLTIGLAMAAGTGFAAGDFPYNQDLLLDAAPMRPAKRVPILNVAPDGSATIDLWCRTVMGRMEIVDAAIRIETGPLPETLPQMMSDGQCTPARMQADQDVLAALLQTTGWQRRGNAVLLGGPAPMRFRISDH